MFKQFRGKYSRKKTKKLNRDVISYEEVPLDNYEEKTTRVSVVDAKKVIKILAVIAVLGLIVFAFANRENLTPENLSNWFKYDVLGQGEGGGYPVNITGTRIDGNNFVAVGTNVAYASDTSFVSLSSNASVIQNTQLSYSSSALVNSGSNTLIYSIGSKAFQVGTLNELKYSGEAQEDIFVGDINNSGDYALVTQTSGYLSKLYVYNKDNQQTYAYSFADYYINAIALNSSGTGGVACGISAESGSLQGIIYVLDFSSEEPKETYALHENVIYKTEYLNNNQVCLIGNTASYVLDLAAGKLNENKYDQMTLTAFDINEDAGTFALSLSRSGDGHSCNIESFNSAGELLGNRETDLQVTSLSMYKGRTAALSNDTIYLYDAQGNEMGSTDAGNGASQVRLFHENTAYVLGVNEIRKVELKNN